MFHRTWIVAVVLCALAGGVGCGSSSSGSGCTPDCRSGYACVSGMCVSACNPACPSGQVCQTTSTGPMCFILVGPDGGVVVGSDVPATGTDVQPGTDVPVTGTDVPVTGTDVPVTGTDVQPGTDVSTTGSDVVVMNTDGGLGALPCGHPGQMCCDGQICLVGGICNETIMNGMFTASVCAAYNPPAGSCDAPSNCTGGQVCLATTCGTNACFQCAAPLGSGANGSACTSSMQCASNDCSNGQCTVPCDATPDCAGLGANWICTAYSYGGTFSTTTQSYFNHGTCVRGCQRNQDCNAGEVCSPNENFLTDRLDFMCRTTPSVGGTPLNAAGVTCTTGSTCQSYFCIPGGSGTGTFCTAPCQADGDCPAAAPHCNPLSVFTPSGGLESVHFCQTT